MLKLFHVLAVGSLDYRTNPWRGRGPSRPVRLGCVHFPVYAGAHSIDWLIDDGVYRQSINQAMDSILISSLGSIIWLLFFHILGTEEITPSTRVTWTIARICGLWKRRAALTSWWRTPLDHCKRKWHRETLSSSISLSTGLKRRISRRNDSHLSIFSVRGEQFFEAIFLN